MCVGGQGRNPTEDGGTFVQPSFSCQKLGFESMGSLPSHSGIHLEFSGPVKSGKAKLWSYKKIKGCCFGAAASPPEWGQGHGKVGMQSLRRLLSMNPCLCHLWALTHTEESSEHQSIVWENRATCGASPGPIPAPAQREGREKGP